MHEGESRSRSACFVGAGWRREGNCSADASEGEVPDLDERMCSVFGCSELTLAAATAAAAQQKLASDARIVALQERLDAEVRRF